MSGTLPLMQLHPADWVEKMGLLMLAVWLTELGLTVQEKHLIRQVGKTAQYVFPVITLIFISEAVTVSIS